jgi:hypothetical protein
MGGVECVHLCLLGVSVRVWMCVCVCVVCVWMCVCVFCSAAGRRRSLITRDTVMPPPTHTHLHRWWRPPPRSAPLQKARRQQQQQQRHRIKSHAGTPTSCSFSPTSPSPAPRCGFVTPWRVVSCAFLGGGGLLHFGGGVLSCLVWSSSFSFLAFDFDLDFGGHDGVKNWWFDCLIRHALAVIERRDWAGMEWNGMQLKPMLLVTLIYLFTSPFSPGCQRAGLQGEVVQTGQNRRHLPDTVG